ncbi:MAG: TonB-dependent receptor [Rhodocyclaceae bacterium]|nr:TonB-dependent receptor [Rhodocyclaceae bacterium]
MRKFAVAISFIAILTPFPAQADTDVGVEQLLALSLEDLMTSRVKISTSTERELSKAPSVVSVITADDIKATGATNLTDILGSIPGIYIRTNLFGFRPLVTFRGAAGTHTLLMVNGTPIRDLVWSSGIFWKGLPTSMIDRVEIIRGPGSALYGSDASAGVINVVTKTAGRITQSEAGVRVGSFDSQDAWVQHGGNWNGYDVGFTAELSHTGGHDPFIAGDGQTTKDLAYGTHASYAPGYAHYGWDNADFHFSMASGNWHLNTDYSRHSNVEIGLTGAAVLDPLTRGSDGRLNIQMLYGNAEFARDWALNAELRYTRIDYTSGNGFQENPPGLKDATGTYPAGFINQQSSAEGGITFEVSGLYTGVRGHSIRVGGGGNSEDLYSVEHYVNKGTGPNGTTLPAGGPLVNLSGTPYAFAPEKIRQVNYLFVQDMWTLSPNWELTAGARYDHYSDFGGTVNPRLALVWQTTESLTTKLMYGRAFRAPSYLELYSLTASNKPNANLTPERSRTWDLAFDYAASRTFKVGIDFYVFSQFNIIGADASKQYQNIGDLTARGIELEAQWQATRSLRLAGSLSTRSEDYSPFRTFNVPKQSAYLRGDWAVGPGWNWNVQATRTGRHLIPTTDPRPPLDAYTIVDTTIRYSPRKDWELAASVRNLFGTDAWEYTSTAIPNYLPLPGRSLFAELRYKL